jgi:hypothetical protein
LIDLPAGAKFGDLSFDQNGEVYWSYFEGGVGATILTEVGKVVQFRRIDGKTFGFPLVQRFSDGRWLVIEARTDARANNAFVFSPEGSEINSFYAGDGIQAVIVDRRDKIWIGYFDEGVFGAFNPTPPQGDKSYRYGPSGLLRMDDKGTIEFAFNDRHPDKSIADIQAVTIDDDSRVWFCPYEKNYLASISDNSVDFVLDKSPASLPDALGVTPSHFAFFGGYQRRSMVAVVERETLKLRLIQLHVVSGDTLSPSRVATRGDKAIAVANGKLYQLDMSVLLNALGAWTEQNSSTVASAVQYEDEESSYAGYDIIYPKVKHVAGKPRPPENQPRHDEDTGN